MKLDLVSTDKFNIGNAYILSEFAKLVYEGYTNVAKTLKEWNCKFEWFDNEGTQALIAYAPNNNIILAFRGTEPQNLGDWVIDANIVKTRTDVGYVHKGFLKAWRAISADVIKVISDILIHKRLWVTGHSLGGALATISLMSSLPLQGYIAGIYTFGSPRVGNKRFASNFNYLTKNKAYRVVNNCDMITRVPPRVGGYNHCGKLIYIDKDGKFHIDDAPNWWETFWDRVGGRLEGFLHLNMLDGCNDHKLDNYIEVIKKEARNV